MGGSMRKSDTRYFFLFPFPLSFLLTVNGIPKCKYELLPAVVELTIQNEKSTLRMKCFEPCCAII